MVTTRGQRSNPASQDEGSLVAGRSRKRSRATREEVDLVSADKEEVRMPAKKQKVLPLREKDEEGPKRNSRVVVGIPVSSIPVELRNVEEVGEQNAEEGDSDEEENEDEEENGEEYDSTEVVRIEISDSESDDESEAPEEVTKPRPAMPPKETKPTPSPKKSSATAQPKHKRFGSQEPELEPELEPEFFSTAVEVLELDEESSDDDAPEVVGAQDALESAQSKARDTAKAVEGQETAIRKKRQKRDATLKEQAEAANMKRRRAEQAEEKAQRPSKEAELDKEDGIEVNGVEDVVPTEKPLPINRSNLPALLPDEYLQDDSESESHSDLELEEVGSKPKKIKFTDLIEKKPKDRRKGSTTYRVSEVRSKHLAPRSSFHAKTTKEAWLKGRASNGGGGVRKAVSSGVFKKN